MASQNKKAKQVNSYCVGSVLKNKGDKLNRIFFYTIISKKTTKQIQFGR